MFITFSLSWRVSEEPTDSNYQVVNLKIIYRQAMKGFEWSTWGFCSLTWGSCKKLISWTRPSTFRHWNLCPWDCCSQPRHRTHLRETSFQDHSSLCLTLAQQACRQLLHKVSCYITATGCCKPFFSLLVQVPRQAKMQNIARIVWGMGISVVDD